MKRDIIVNVQYEITINSDIDLSDKIISWVKEKATELGTGRHYEPYPLDHDFSNDLFIDFYVKIKKES